MKKNDGNELAKSVSDRIRFSPCSPCLEARSHYLRMPEQDQIKVRSIHTKIPVAYVESRGSEILAFEKTDDVTANWSEALSDGLSWWPCCTPSLQRLLSGEDCHDSFEMPKDKHENNDVRRTYTLMSPEDVANGKKSKWTELEITATIRNLSPSLWRLDFLTALFLNDNHLTKIPPEISKLAQLKHLDLSSNKLRSLPCELGDLVTLRELLLCNNSLRLLPNELGKLFQLQTLGLQGNPLPQDVLTINEEKNGTAKLLGYMLDNLAGK